MSDVAIRAEGLGKRYRIGATAQRHEDMRSALTAAMKAPFRNLSRLRGLSRFTEGDEESTVWALQDVSFEVKEGEVLGIIGRNGAGKSTLLKILSRITEPTAGRVRVRGRVGALLEVGTGFHPELTGRENVYLNGSILGMDKRYIRCKFDEIVDFSGVAKFIDTPVKRYSSGMYLRLAFAVAAHLEPEILVIDEILAVGDVDFQAKCLGKMGQVAGQGRTVLFVSHNLAAVGDLCPHGILLDHGRISAVGTTQDVIQAYIAAAAIESTTDRNSYHGHGGVAHITGVRIHNAAGDLTRTVLSGEMCRIVVEYESDKPLRQCGVAVGIYSATGLKIALLDSYVRIGYIELPNGAHAFQCMIPRLPLFADRYYINAALTHRGELLHGVARVADFTVEPGNFFGTGRLPAFGPVLIDHEWEMR